MIKKYLLALLFLQALNNAFSQNLFYYDYSYYNPAYVGMYDKNNITFSTHEFHYEDLNVSAGRLALSLPLKKIYSAVGVHSNYDKMGFDSNFDLGLMYSLKYNFGNDFSISFGANVSLNKFRINGEFWIPEDGYGNFYEKYVDETIILFNIDLGVWLRYKNIQVGFANQHVNQPSKKYHFIDTIAIHKLNKVTNFIFSYHVKIGQNNCLNNSILIYDLKRFEDDKDMIINNLYEIRSKYIVGLTTNLFKGNKVRVFLSPNIGFKLNDKFRFVAAIELLKINANNSVGRTMEGILTYNF